MKYGFLGALVIGLLTFIPTTHAYLTTNQVSFSTDEKMGIFLVEYKFGHESHEIHLPVLAREGNELFRDSLSYLIVDEDGNPAPGTTSGIVLSTAPYENGHYETKRGTAGTFTLFVAFTPDTQKKTQDYHLEVTSLPFSFDGKTELQLNPSELQYYKTPTLTLPHDTNQ